ELDGSGRAAVESALDAVEVRARLERDALHFGNGATLGVPRGIGELEGDALRVAFENAPRLEVARRVELTAVPHAEAAAAARASDVVGIEPFAMIAVIVIAGVPLVDDQAGRALHPHIDAAADRALAFDQRRAVHAEGDAIVLPREVVH